MKLFHEIVVKEQSLHGYRRITYVVIRSVRTEGGCRHGAYWLSKVLNHLEIMLVILII